MRKRRFILICLAAAIASACNPQPGAIPLPQSTSQSPATPLNSDDAQRVAADFLNTWMIDGYDGMYALLTVNSRDAYNRVDFQNFYRNAENIMTLASGGKSYQLTNLIQQGDNVDVAYDVTFKTKLFGTFTDSGRVIHLTSTSDGWRVAWSQDDVFTGMKDGAKLEVQQTAPNRANIYDRDGQVIADEHGVAIRVTLLTKSYPTNAPDDCFNQLARVFKSRTAEQMKTIYGPRTGQDFAYEIGLLSQEVFTAERPNLEKVCKLTYDQQATRRYVEGGLAPHVVGYVGRIPAEQVDYWVSRGYSPDALVGLDGIESAWEDTLAGTPEAKLLLTDGGTITRIIADRPAVPSQSVYLSLDRKLQTSVQSILADAFKNAVWGAWSTGGAAIVMDVHTGEILAIASYPDFNIDAFNPYTALPNAQELINAWAKDPKKPTFNRATLGVYPPGSVFKIVGMAAAADSGKFNLNTTYYCSGVWNGTSIGDRTRYDWIYTMGPGRHGTLTLKQALTGSCDTYFWNVGWTLNNADPHILIDYAKKFGFAAPTGIKGVSEATGSLPNPDTYTSDGIKWRGSDALNTVIGQGAVQVTPLQIVRMVAAVANGGTLYQPLLVEKYGIIGQADAQRVKPIVSSQLGIKPEILQGIRDAMCAVTTDQTLGTATFVYQGFKGAVVCGKTGTAESGLSNDPPHAWFAAFAGKTADKPDIAIVAMIEHSNEGSYIAAPIVRRIVETYYGLDITPWPAWYGAREQLPALGSTGD